MAKNNRRPPTIPVPRKNAVAAALSAAKGPTVVPIGATGRALVQQTMARQAQERNDLVQILASDVKLDHTRKWDFDAGILAFVAVAPASTAPSATAPAKSPAKPAK